MPAPLIKKRTIRQAHDEVFRRDSRRRPASQRGERGSPNAAGQAILVVVILIGGIFMMTTALSGLLMFYQLQQSTDAGNSTIAIFAADAGIERASYCYFYEYPTNLCNFTGTALGNGATFITEVFVSATSTLVHAEGIDAFARTRRALETTFRIAP